MTAQILGMLELAPVSSEAGGVGDVTVVERGRELVAAGADLVGVIARPGRSAAEVGAVVADLAGTTRVAIATDEPDLACAALSAGATVLDDVGGALEAVALEAPAATGWILVHQQADEADPGRGSGDADGGGERDGGARRAQRVADVLAERARRASTAGVAEVWIDPGFGAGGTPGGTVAYPDDLVILAHLDRLTATGWPVAIDARPLDRWPAGAGPSLDKRAPVVDDVEEGVPSGSVAATAYAVTRGVALIRAHDVKAIRQAVVVASGYTQFRRT